jgi:hypothetical protein
MSERGRDLFDRYILELLAEAEDRNIALEAAVAGLKAAAVSSGVHVQEIEEEVGRIGNALNAALERERQNAQRT